MRERLIELIKSYKLTMIYLPIAMVRRLADYLLKNGVIVPPCKEGDTVYCVWRYEDWFGKVDGPFIEEDVCQGIVIDLGQVKILPTKYGSRTDSFYRLLDCCLTKEEAEQALKGGEG